MNINFNVIFHVKKYGNIVLYVRGDIIVISERKNLC